MGEIRDVASSSRDQWRTSAEAMPSRPPAKPVGGTSSVPPMDRVVRLAVDTMGATFGSVTLMTAAGVFETLHATHADAARADSLQYELDEGPCLDAAQDDRAFVVADLLEDDRWPRWRPQATALGITSIVSAKLDAGNRRLGSLNLYGPALEQMSPPQTSHAPVLAEMISLFLDRLTVEEQLVTALDTRAEIGRAQGMLMERFGIAADQAFDVLRRYSQTNNVKLRDIAAQIVETRRLPEPLERAAAVSRG